MSISNKTTIITTEGPTAISSVAEGMTVFNSYGMVATVTSVSKSKQQTYTITTYSNESYVVAGDQLLTVYDDTNNIINGTVDQISELLSVTPLFIAATLPVAYETKPTTITDILKCASNITGDQLKDLPAELTLNDVEIRQRVLNGLRRNKNLYYDNCFHVAKDDDVGFSVLVQLISSLGLVPVILSKDEDDEDEIRVLASYQPRRQIKSIEKYRTINTVAITTDGGDDNNHTFLIGDNYFVVNDSTIKND